MLKNGRAAAEQRHAGARGNTDEPVSPHKRQGDRRCARLILALAAMLLLAVATPASAQSVVSWLTKSRSISTPPGAPAQGDRYIVGASPTGAWAGHANDVASWNGAQWGFITAREGLSEWIQDEPAHVLYFDGTSWGTIQTFSAASPRNFVRNPSFDLWQAGTSFVAITYGPDLWKQSTTAARTFSRQAGFSNARFCYRAQRDNASATTQAINIAQVFGPEASIQVGGKSVILSADLRLGANFSGSTVGAILTSGTGTDEVYALGTATFPTGSVLSALSSSATQSTTAQRISWGPYTVPAGITEIGIKFGYTPVGTAGAADYFEITNVKLEVGTTVTSFEAEPFAVTFASALRLYRKSFLDATTPAQNAGAGTGELLFPATRAGALMNRLGTVQFGAPMRAIPTVTLFNPAAANAQCRDLTAGADGSATTAANISDKGFEITCTANAATVVGNDLGVHWIADARAF